MKVIEELWCGDLKMGEREVHQGSRLRRSMDRVSRAGEKLVEALNEEQRKMPEALMGEQLTLTAGSECGAFTRRSAVWYEDDGGPWRG